MKEIISGLKNILNLLDGFSEDEIDALINNRAKLNIEYYKIPQAKKAEKVRAYRKKEVDVESICMRIDKMTSRKEAADYLESMKLRKTSLKEIAKHYNISITTRDSNPKLVSKIVEGVIGAKIRFDALLNTDI